MLDIDIRTPVKTWQGEGKYVGERIVLLRLMHCNLKCSWCLAPATRLATKDGHKRITDVLIGEEVYGYKSGKVVLTKVLERSGRIVRRDELLRMKTERSDNIYATREHMFFVDGRWKQIDSIVAGDEVYQFPADLYMLKHMTGKGNPVHSVPVEVLRERIGKINNRRSWEEKNGKVRAEELKLLYSRRMKENNPMFNESSKKKMFERKTYPVSAIEYRVASLAEKANIPLMHTAGRLTNGIVGSDEKYSFPDFIVLGQEKKVIEVYDKMWPVRKEGWKDRKKKIYDEAGIKCLFLEVNRKVTDDEIVKKLGDFVLNGKKVLEVSSITRKQASDLGSGRWGKGGNQEFVAVYNLTTETGNYFANGLLSHNCDTKWTWDGTESGKSYEDVVELVKEIVKKSKGRIEPARWEVEKKGLFVRAKKKERGWKDAKIVMITGGEPMMQQNNPSFRQLIESLNENGFSVHIETNGTIAVGEWAKKNIDFFDISPKVVLYPGAYTEEKARSYKEAKEHAWKFVIQYGSDVLNVRDFLEKCRIGFDEEIWLMPLTDEKRNMSRSLDAIKQTGMIDGLSMLGYKNVKVSERRQVTEGFA